ncbi:thiamine pyrophosphate-requiring protein [Comamonas testosteroni]|uniref:Acetolactate synthase n=1 Tax=Comamonas testosteroni TaxID=285 RepID=A0A096FDI5_COMTE|nr:thiamine pyrophosphate-requiring protein [Comamonas testosteroni]KGH28009.1 acetolactate synthase [Comamonas testosteroni]
MTQALRADAHSTVRTESVAEAFLVLLKDRGVDYFYVGAGTDTAPVIEAYARAASAGLALPEPILIAHENLAIGMAHGFYMVARRPQAVMLHVSVGTANAVCGLFNAIRAQVPLLLAAGRTPWFEHGRTGSRTHEVHWAQEMFDQGAMVRELVKWDYELRDGMQVADVVDRALGVATTEPRGPVYVTLPREVLAQPKDSCPVGHNVPIASSAHPDPSAVQKLARALASAELPVVVCTSSGADPQTVAQLTELADRFGIGVAENRPRYVSFPSSHPLHLGYDMGTVLPQADALLFLETDVPWIPTAMEPRAGAFVALAGSDPLFARYPMRNFASDLCITSNASALLAALIPALEAVGAQRGAQARSLRAQAMSKAVRAGVAERAQRDEARGGAISKLFLSRCLEAVRPRDAIVINEYSAMREQMDFEEAGGFFQLPSSGGLGWGLPAALGAQQAAPGRTVICVLGDGAYLFANPAACHHAAAMHHLPVLTVVFNNEAWEGVQKAATGMYPQGHAAHQARERQAQPLSSLRPVPDFERYCEASGGYGERVTHREDLLPALRRALHAVQAEGRQALLNVIGE